MKKLPLFGCLELRGKFEGMDCSEDFRLDYLKKARLVFIHAFE